jgi:FMN phosphatase YigB (HAD superfamily)
MTGRRRGPWRFQAVALDFGGTISTGREDHLIGQKAVDPEAAVALHELAGLGLRLVLATNATAAETRWPALQAAGVHDLFAVALISYALNVGKDEPLFYDLVITAAQCPPREILFVGDRIDYDVAAPMRAGMRACLVRPGGLRPGESLPGGALLVRHVRELPALVEAG